MANASRTTDVLTVGMNWYPNPFVKWMVNFDRSVFANGSGRGAANTLALRAQLEF
jgi:phosphate-selective porin